MKTKIVSSKDIYASKGLRLRAKDYITEPSTPKRKRRREAGLPATGNENSTTEDLSDLVWQAINEVAAQCYYTSKSKGWWEKYDLPEAALFREEILASKLMLIVSELAESLEEIRIGCDPAVVYYSGTFEEDGVMGPCFSAVPTKECKKPEGIPIELADNIIRIFDLAHREGIDIGEAIRIKMTYNEGRAHKHGGKTF